MLVYEAVKEAASAMVMISDVLPETLDDLIHFNRAFIIESLDKPQEYACSSRRGCFLDQQVTR